MAIWKQNGTRAELHCSHGMFWAEMPDGWKLDDCHPTTLAAASWLLLHNVPDMEGEYPPAATILDMPKRPRGVRPLLAFSGGVDSMASLMVMPPDTIPFYCRRPYSSYRRSDGIPIKLAPFDPIGRCLDAVGNVTSVPNTFELIGIQRGTTHGFRDDCGYAVMACLLADHLGGGLVAFGAVLEGQVTNRGLFFGLSASGIREDILCHAGLVTCFPVGGCSEVATANIVAASRWRNVVVPCPKTAADGTPCGKCYKCFRKLRLLGLPAPEPGANALTYLTKRPIPTAGSAIYACQKSGWWGKEVEEYRDVDLGFLDRHYAPALKAYMPFELAEYVGHWLRRFGVEPMDASDEAKLKAMGSIFWPEKHQQLWGEKCE